MRREQTVVALRDEQRSAPTLADETLANACSAGDPAAVAELFDRHQAALTRYLRRLMPSSDEVEDVLQTTFLQVARGSVRFERRGSVRSWLFGIATNCVRHHVRARARRFRLRSALRDECSDRCAPRVDHVSEARQLLRRADAALGSLSSDLRFAFVLCEIEGFSAREAAGMLGTSEAAVWRRVCDARRRLRESLSEEVP